MIKSWAPNDSFRLQCVAKVAKRHGLQKRKYCREEMIIPGIKSLKLVKTATSLSFFIYRELDVFSMGIELSRNNELSASKPVAKQIPKHLTVHGKKERSVCSFPNRRIFDPCSAVGWIPMCSSNKIPILDHSISILATHYTLWVAAM